MLLAESKFMTFFPFQIACTDGINAIDFFSQIEDIEIAEAIHSERKSKGIKIEEYL